MLQNNSILENETQPQDETETDDLIFSDGEEPPISVHVLRPLPSKDTLDGGFLIVWGCGEFGQHGHGHSEDVLCCDAIASPVWLGQERMVVEVACGSSHTLILTDDNKVYSWGNSNSGQLGVGTTETSPHPRPLHIGVSSGTKLRGITCGTRHSFVWTQDGDCFSFGNNYSAQLGYDFRKPDFKENQLKPIFVDTLLHRPVSQVACGARHSVFLFTNGQVAAVGVNNRGQIGCGDTVDAICPKTIPDLPAISIIACGNSHNIAADVHGSVYVWGYSKACGSKTDVLSPLSVYSYSEQDSVVDIAGGDSHSMILTSSGTVYSWGNNFEGQLGLGKSVKFLSKPTELSCSLLPGTVISVSVGENTCAAVTEDGKLYLWGKNASQVIRDNESSRFFQFEPYHVHLGVWKALKVSCGSWHVACVVCSSEENKRNEIHEEKSEIMSMNDDIEVEYGYLDSLNHQRNDKQKIELNMESKAVVDEKSSPAPAVSLMDKDQPYRGVARDLIIDGNQERTELIPAATINEIKNSGKGIAEEVNSSHSDGEGNCDCDKKAEEDGVFDDEAVDDISNFEPVVEQILEEKPKVIETSEIGEKPDQVMDEEKPALSLNIVKSFDDARAGEINEQVAKKTYVDCVSKESDNTEHEFEHESETVVEATWVEQEKPAAQSKEITSRVTRARAHSEQRSSTDSHRVPKDISSGLRSGSLDSMKLYRQQEDGMKGARPSRLTYSPPANARSPGGHLRREKKPARMLRHTSYSADYHLPNQPVHTVDINITPSQLRPHPPINRTQSSPSLYSSNLIRSPLGARRKNSASAKVPRPPTSSLNSDDGLPPRPPGRGVRRPFELNPVFSSGTSWRKRK